jgi:hypothetical protein
MMALNFFKVVHADAALEDVRTPQLDVPVGDASAAAEVLTTAELASFLRCSESAARRLNLPAVEVGRGRWRYVKAQVLEELARRASRGGLAIARGA